MGRYQALDNVRREYFIMFPGVGGVMNGSKLRTGLAVWQGIKRQRRSA